MAVYLRHHAASRGRERLPTGGQHGDVGRDAGRLLWQEAHAGPQNGDGGYQGQETRAHRMRKMVLTYISIFGRVLLGKTKLGWLDERRAT
jgi:hypothetical protein